MPHSFLNRARHHHVDGLVLMGIDQHDPELDRLVSAGIPTIAVDIELTGPRADTSTRTTSRAPRLPSATSGSWVIAGSRRSPAIRTRSPGVDRLEGFRATLAELGGEQRTPTSRRATSTPRAVTRRCSGCSVLAEPPTAVFAAADLIAVGAIKAIQDAGLRCPEDGFFGKVARHDHARSQPVRRLRLPRPLQAVRGGAPGRHDQGRHPGLRDAPLQPRQAPRHRRRAPPTSRRSRSGSSPSSRPAAALRRPAAVRRRVAEEPVAAVEVAAVARAERSADRPRHRRRQPRRSATAATCSRRPACRATATRSRSSGRPGRPSSRSASGSRRRRRRASTSSTRAATSTTRSSPRQPGVLRRVRQGDRGLEPQGQAGLEPDDAGHPKATSPPASPRSAPTGTPASRRAPSPRSPARPG